MANYIVKNNNMITMTRGDFFKFNISLVCNEFPLTGDWKLDEGDLVYFAIMEPHQSFEEALIKKELTSADYDSDGNLWLKLYPEDTLDLIPGTYYYQVKALYKVSGDEDIHLDTIIQKTRFIVVD